MQEEKKWDLTLGASDGGGETGGVSFGYVSEDTVTEAIKAVSAVVKAAEATA